VKAQNIAAVQFRSDIPDQIHFTAHGVYPEGIAFDRFNNRFLVSSFATGTIGTVRFSGVYSPFIQDPDLHSTLGLAIDEARKQLVVVSGFADNIAELGIYNLQTGNRIRLVDLAALRPNGAHGADDVAIDPEGNKYVTDAKSPIIYKIDQNGNPSVFFENDLFAEPPGFPYIWVGFNGIAYDKNGNLIVGFYSGSKLSDGKNVFVLYSYLHKVFFNADFSQTEFIIQKMPFENTKTL
jgi:DNA-binding beta-propeller fold protein YncE